MEAPLVSEGDRRTTLTCQKKKLYLNKEIVCVCEYIYNNLSFKIYYKNIVEKVFFRKIISPKHNL